METLLLQLGFFSKLIKRYFWWYLIAKEILIRNSGCLRQTNLGGQGKGEGGIRETCISLNTLLDFVQYASIVYSKIENIRKVNINKDREGKGHKQFCPITLIKKEAQAYWFLENFFCCYCGLASDVFAAFHNLR